MPKFSIIIPVYNVENDIRQCLESITSQTFKDFEAIVVDDCGTDGSMEIVEEFAKKDSRFVVLHHEQNQGVSVARNTGLDVMKGEYLVFIDPDDYFEENALEVMNLAFTLSRKDILFFGHNRVSKTETYKNEIRQPSKVFYVTVKALDYLVGVLWNKAYKASIVKKHNIRFPKGLIVEDMEFTFKYLCHVDQFAYLQDSLYNYRVDREGSYTTEDNKVLERIRDEFEIFNHCYDYMIEKGVDSFKPYIVMYLGRLARRILLVTHRREYILNEVDKLLERMNFPKDYEFMEKVRVFQMGNK